MPMIMTQATVMLIPREDDANDNDIGNGDVDDKG